VQCTGCLHKFKRLMLVSQNVIIGCKRLVSYSLSVHRLSYDVNSFFVTFCSSCYAFFRPPVSELSAVELAEVQNRTLLASYLARIETAKVTDRHRATDMVSATENSGSFVRYYFAVAFIATYLSQVTVLPLPSGMTAGAIQC